MAALADGTEAPATALCPVETADKAVTTFNILKDWLVPVRRFRTA